MEHLGELNGTYWDLDSREEHMMSDVSFSDDDNGDGEISTRTISEDNGEETAVKELTVDTDEYSMNIPNDLNQRSKHSILESQIEILKQTIDEERKKMVDYVTGLNRTVGNRITRMEQKTNSYSRMKKIAFLVACVIMAGIAAFHRFENHLQQDTFKQVKRTKPVGDKKILDILSLENLGPDEDVCSVQDGTKCTNMEKELMSIKETLIKVEKDLLSMQKSTNSFMDRAMAFLCNSRELITVIVTLSISAIFQRLRNNEVNTITEKIKVMQDDMGSLKNLKDNKMKGKFDVLLKHTSDLHEGRNKIGTFFKHYTKSECFDEHECLYTVPLTGTYLFGGYMFQDGKGVLELYVTEGEDNWNRITRTSRNGAWATGMAFVYLMKGSKVKLEVERKKGQAKVLYCSMYGHLV